MKGHEYERANICAECEGPLAAQDGHYHSRRAFPYGSEPLCCNCVSNQICSDKPLAILKADVVGYSQKKTQAPQKGGNRGNQEQEDEEDSSREEQEDMSKTSQKNQKVAKAMKGQAKAKAEKKTGAGRPRKEKIPYVFKPLSKSFSGVAGKATMDGSVLKHVPFHQVADGQTACGYSVTETSKGMDNYELNWAPVEGKVSCGRCLRNIAKAKKPVSLNGAKKAKAAKKTAAK